MRLIAILLVLLFSFGANAQEWRQVKTQWLDLDGTSRAATDQIGAYINAVRLICSSNCYYAIAASTEVAHAIAENATTHYLPNDEPVTVLVSPNSRIAAIQVSEGGTLFITELSR